MKLITHTDLDGVSCAIVGGDYFDEMFFVDYGEVTETVFELLNSEEPFYITDLGITEEVADAIDASLNEVVYIDHHTSNEWLNKYDWAYVWPELFGVRESATSLLFGYMKSNDLEVNVNTSFVDLVRSYDTWEWKETGNIKARDLARLFKELGREQFIEENPRGVVQFTSEQIYLLDMLKKKIQRKTDSIELDEYQIGDYNFGIGFCEEYISEIANKLCEKHDFDGVALINPGRKAVSLRTNRNDINLGELASKFGGGGHPKAAGFRYDIDLKEVIANETFKQ